jgi:hypothetical protein
MEHLRQSFVPNQQPTERPEPRNRAFNDPTFLIDAHPAEIFPLAIHAIGAMGRAAMRARNVSLS